MRGIVTDFLGACFMGLVLPGLIFCGALALEQGSDIREQSRQTQPEEKPDVTIRVRTGEQVENCGLNDYLLGVVLAEMPVEFEEEALKAQSVAARTYAWKAFTSGGKHGDGSVCTDSTCCQSYILPQQYLQQGGTPAGVQKARDAVKATWGLVLTYEGNLIEATYFSSSGGSTEDARAVWGTDYPYLKAVSSPGEEEARYHRHTAVYTPEDFARLLGLSGEGEPEDWLGDASYTAAGTLKALEICGETYTGMQLRSLLGLPSAALTVTVTGGEICVSTKGHGHRVGMSQYGAEAMALEGNTFRQILAHYYPGTELEYLDERETGR